MRFFRWMRLPFNLAASLSCTFSGDKHHVLGTEEKGTPKMAGGKDAAWQSWWNDETSTWL